MHYADITAADTMLLAAAIAAAERLYHPNIQEVAAALRTSDGQLFSAIHFETATGFATICGEVAAICCMVAAGRRDLDTIVAVWRAPDGACYLLPPCGRCREVIADFNPEAWVIVSRAPDHWDQAAIKQPARVRIAELLPLKSHLLKG
ncbi:MAG TPA: hypothetical protein PKA05_07095 [Roseiflexaceae bacterium]|nr:hypothetical protein [Roseiflexaceae bacterium]HMP40129.1 hypothetical protein [Roseiflexaceae bacterium]